MDSHSDDREEPLAVDLSNCHYPESRSDGMIQIVLNVPLGAWPAAAPLVHRLKELEAGAVAATLTNRQKVRALLRRCEMVGREIRIKDVIAAANVDESQFHKWQRVNTLANR
jgi:hypothetical protein